MIGSSNAREAGSAQPDRAILPSLEPTETLKKAECCPAMSGSQSCEGMFAILFGVVKGRTGEDLGKIWGRKLCRERKGKEKVPGERGSARNEWH